MRLLQAAQKSPGPDQHKQNAEQWAELHARALIGEFSSNIAHEINNPLLVLQGYLEKLNENFAIEPVDIKKSKTHLEKIEAMAERIQKIVKTILNHSRHTDAPELKRVHCQAILDEITLLAGQKLKAAGIKLDIINPLGQTPLSCHPVRLSQVLLNLISNAHDAIKGSTNPWVRIEVRAFEQHVQFAVTDSGEGIAQEYCNKIFERGFSTKEQGGGAGIGLALSRTWMDGMGGSLDIAKDDPNTCFIMTIPRLPDKKQAS